MHLYDVVGQADSVLLHMQRLHPPFLLLVQKLTQLCGDFCLEESEPQMKKPLTEAIKPQQELNRLEVVAPEASGVGGLPINGGWLALTLTLTPNLTLTLTLT